jgi:PKD repeat protein
MIRRIRYLGTNDPPSAVASAFPTAGLPPLAVDFSSAGSLDPEGRPITFLWTFGDGQTSMLPNPSHTYQQAGMYSIRLAVSDGVNTSLSTPLAIVVGNPPTVTIQNPTNGLVFRAGDVINFSGSATDPEDGPLPPSALNWTIVFHHATHIHPVSGPWSGTNRGSLTIPSVGHPYGHDTSYEIILIATDSSGLQSSASVMVYPDLIDLSVDTSPTGLTVKLDGISRVAPFTDGTLIGFQHTVDAPDQTTSGSTFLFQAWSDGGAQSHSLVVPPSDVALTAAYRVTLPGVPVIELAQWQGTAFRLVFTSEAGRFYRVERSRTLLPGSWVTVADQVPGTGALVEVIDTAANAAEQGFYRVLLLVPVASGPPGFAVSAGAHDLDTSVLSTSLNSAGADRVLVVGLCWDDDYADLTPSVTYGGITCAPVRATNWFYGSGKVAIYSLTAPPVGDHTLQVTLPDVATEISMSGLILTNANQISSIGSAAGYFSDGPVTSIGVNVSSTTNDLVVDVLGYYALEPTPDAGQIERAVSDNLGYASTRMSTKPGAAGSTFMSWSLSDITEVSQIAVTIKGR